MVEYSARKIDQAPELDGAWDSTPWKDANVAPINNFHPKSISRHLVAAVKVLHTGDALHLLFKVEDNHVMAKCQNRQDSVCRDSCVEAFLQPKEGGGYLNFEVNCGGTILLYHIWDWTRGEKGFKGYAPVADKWLDKIGIYHSLPKIVDPPIAEPTTWRLQLRVPVEIFEAHTGSVGKLDGQSWLGNFYKCGGDPKFDHWAEWSPVVELNFHQPKHYAPIHFEG